MSNGLLLWVDDEIELLRAHIIFLEKKGYEVVTVSNGADAIDQCRQQTFDLILLDEMMPGLSGLETLQQIKDIQPATPIVMCTKSEEENIMDQAIGSKIADYLIKPVNPNQILLSLKKNIHRKDIVTEVTQSGYQQDYQQIAMQMMDCRTCSDWMEIYRRLVKWELELSDTDSSMTEMLTMQKEEANIGFAKYIAKNYLDWVEESGQGGGRQTRNESGHLQDQALPDARQGGKGVPHRDRQLPLRPVEDAGERHRRHVRHRGRHVYEHSAYSHPVCQKCHLQRADAKQDSRNVSRTLGRRGRRGRQEPQREAAHPDPAGQIPQAQQLQLSQGERFGRSRQVPGTLQRMQEQRPERARHQLHRHALACTYRIKDG